jgi:hypothetical protein
MKNAKNIHRSTIIVDSITYYWDAEEMAYFGVESSGGSNGAALDTQGWFSAWRAPDCCFAQCGSESFDNPASAIRQSYFEFS